MDINISPSVVSPRKARKRPRQEEKWKKNIAKNLRYSPKNMPVYPTCNHNNKTYKCRSLKMAQIKTFHAAFYETKEKYTQDNFSFVFSSGVCVVIDLYNYYILCEVLIIMTKPKGIFKRRKWQGNQHFRTNFLVQAETSRSNVTSPRPDNSTQSRPSASKAKLDESVSDYTKYISDKTNIIVALTLLNTALNKYVVCKSCGGEVILGEVKEKRNGLACNLSLSCLQCHEENQFWTSDKSTKSNLYDINLRMLYGLRCIGKGGEAGKIFPKD